MDANNRETYISNTRVIDPQNLRTQNEKKMSTQDTVAAYSYAIAVNGDEPKCDENLWRKNFW